MLPTVAQQRPSWHHRAQPRVFTDTSGPSSNVFAWLREGSLLSWAPGHHPFSFHPLISIGKDRQVLGGRFPGSSESFLSLLCDCIGSALLLGRWWQSASYALHLMEGWQTQTWAYIVMNIMQWTLYVRIKSFVNFDHILFLKIYLVWFSVFSTNLLCCFRTIHRLWVYGYLSWWIPSTPCPIKEMISWSMHSHTHVLPSEFNFPCVYLKQEH